MRFIDALRYHAKSGSRTGRVTAPDRAVRALVRAVEPKLRHVLGAPGPASGRVHGSCRGDTEAVADHLNSLGFRNRDAALRRERALPYPSPPALDNLPPPLREVRPNGTRGLRLIRLYRELLINGRATP